MEESKNQIKLSKNEVKDQEVKNFLNLDFNTKAKSNSINNLEEIRIFGEVYEDTLFDIDKKLKELNGSSLEILINSPGGNVFDGVAIASLIKRYQGSTTATGIGFVGSIASVILLSADNVRMNKDAFLMIHNAWSFGAGDAEELRQTADILDLISDQIAEVYVGQIFKGQNPTEEEKEEKKKEIQELMNQEAFISAKVALELGLIDEIVEKESEENVDIEVINLVNTKYSAKAQKQFFNKFVNKTLDMSSKEQTPKVEEVSFFDKVKAWFKTNPEEAKQLAEGLEKEQAEKDQEAIQNAIDIAKANGFYKETEEEKIEAPIQEDNSTELKAEVDSLKEIIKRLEVQNAAPSAGDGPKQDVIKNNIDKFAPTAQHKDAVNAFTKIFQ